MRLAAAVLFASLASAQVPAVPRVAETSKSDRGSRPALQNQGKPMLVEFNCTEDDMQWAGMSCLEEQPCPVYLELSTIEVVGNRIIVLGNIHTESTALYSFLVSSDDRGATWSEPYERMRGIGLDRIQLIDFQNGWISGETLVPVSRDPFLLVTSDGGKSWRLRPILTEGAPGAIQQFRFESVTSGAMVIDRMQSVDSSRYELYETPNGGETWMIRRTSDQPITLPHGASDQGNSDWRIRADARSKSFVIEKRHEGRWSTAASFLVDIGVCKPTPHVPPPPEVESAPITQPENQPSLKKARRKP